ncbi:MAG: hypothetical protein U0414_32965 [Polyangiaceae bacterium]
MGIPLPVDPLVGDEDAVVVVGELDVDIDAPVELVAPPEFVVAPPSSHADATRSAAPMNSDAAKNVSGARTDGSYLGA